jgi:CubicO group peptidase (beta-lactamase class C family)
MAIRNMISSRPRRAGCTLALLLVFCATPAAAQHDVTLRSGSPADAGMDPAPLRNGLAMFERAVEAGDLVGAVLFVARNGVIVMHEAVGWRDRARNLPMEKSTMFRMASNTKPVVATGLAILVERDSIGWDDPVYRWLPAWDNWRSGFVQVKHLASHTSGLRIPTLFLSPLMKSDDEHPDAPNLRLEAARFGEVGAAVLPGTSYSYSNPGYNTIGALIELRSGKPIDVFLRDELYSPLGMADTHHMETRAALGDRLDRMAVIYYERRNGDWTPGWSPGDPPISPFVRASGGLISTAADYAVFLQMILNGGFYDGRRYLAPESIRAMTTPRTENLGSKARPAWYGYGWRIEEDGSFGHTGSDGTYAWIDPANGIIGLVLTQTPRGENPRDAFVELVRQSVRN